MMIMKVCVPGVSCRHWPSVSGIIGASEVRRRRGGRLAPAPIRSVPEKCDSCSVSMSAGARACEAKTGSLTTVTHCHCQPGQTNENRNRGTTLYISDLITLRKGIVDNRKFVDDPLTIVRP